MANHDVAQIHPNSCGAACLLCAALELGSVPKASAAKNSLNTKILSGVPLADDRGWQDAIYAVSSGGTFGYSLPAGVVEAATCLGMQPEILMANTWTAWALQRKYPDEVRKCQKSLTRVDAKRLGDLKLKPGERAMHCLWVDKGLHWVLQRDDNSYMDPAGGVAVKDRKTLKATGQQALKKGALVTIPYHGTGLAVKLHK